MTEADVRVEQIKDLQKQSDFYSAEVSSRIRALNLGLLGVVWTVLTTADKLNIDREYVFCQVVKLSTGFKLSLIAIVIFFLMDSFQYLSGLWTAYGSIEHVAPEEEQERIGTATLWDYSNLWYRLVDWLFYGKIGVTVLNGIWIILLLAGALTD